jgi:hypothetical protein
MFTRMASELGVGAELLYAGTLGKGMYSIRLRKYQYSLQEAAIL